MFKIHCIRAIVLIIAVAGLLGVPSKSDAARTTLAVGIYCISLGHSRLECHAEVSGGTGIYTYDWIPDRTGGSDTIAIIPCVNGRLKTVTLVVTDSNGGSGSDYTTAFCGDADNEIP
jgi:hypothetical protein